MPETLKSEISSALLRQQIKNISGYMHNIITKTLSYPLRSMVIFNQTRSDFAKIKNKAYLSCSKIDNAQSIEMGDAAVKATYDLIDTLIDLKNEARQLIENDSQSNELPVRFRKQLEKVERLMNSSISPLIQNPSLSEKGRRQAQETLERWAELYRHGLKASGNISERGEEWLTEAHQRLDLTADALRQLDIKNEAIATQDRQNKKPLPD